MPEFFDIVLARFNYWIYVILMMIGLFAMITKKNLIKKLIGMSIFQTAIILFFVSLGVKEGATLPIISHHGSHEDAYHEVSHHQGRLVENPEAHAAEDEDAHNAFGEYTFPDDSEAAGHRRETSASPDADTFANPLPHVLMLTAIVVGVATLGVGLAIAQVVFLRFQTLEEDKILNQIRSSDD